MFTSDQLDALRTVANSLSGNVLTGSIVAKAADDIEDMQKLLYGKSTDVSRDVDHAIRSLLYWIDPMPDWLSHALAAQSELSFDLSIKEAVQILTVLSGRLNLYGPLADYLAEAMNDGVPEVGALVRSTLARERQFLRTAVCSRCLHEPGRMVQQNGDWRHEYEEPSRTMECLASTIINLIIDAGGTP